MTNKPNNIGNNNLKWYGLPFMLVGLLIVGAILFDDNKKSTEITDSIDNLYGQELSGIVATISQNRGTVSLRFKDCSKKRIFFSSTSNSSLTPSFIDDFIKGGDSIFKAKNSMELEVYRGKMRFHFILNERIDK
jgi:hypothetical protein